MCFSFFLSHMTQITAQYDTNNFRSGTNTKEYIMLHHTATGEGTLQGIINAFTTGNQVSAHYIIDTNGDIIQIGNDDMILWHAGTGTWNGITDMNRHSIGIEVIGPLPGFTDAQREACSQLIQDLALKHDIPAENVIRHQDLSLIHI